MSNTACTAQRSTVRVSLLASIAVCGLAFGAAAPRAGAQTTSPPSLPPVTEDDRAAAFPDLGHSSDAEIHAEDPFNRLVQVDRFEAHDTHDDVANWDLEAWFGRSLNKLWVRSEGERESGDTDYADLEVLWGHSFARWWEFVVGARRDFEPGPERSWAAFGVQGLAPYRFELEATVYLGENGRAAARVEAEYDLLITNRLILQPLLEIDWYSRDEAMRGFGSGLAEAKAGLRLRYAFRREVAPYVGLVRAKQFGNTADLARLAGEEADDTRLVAGIRIWF